MPDKPDELSNLGLDALYRLLSEATCNHRWVQVEHKQIREPGEEGFSPVFVEEVCSQCGVGKKCAEQAEFLLLLSLAETCGSEHNFKEGAD